MEPKYPFIVEKYLDLGKFCKSEQIPHELGDRIKKALNDYRACYSGVYRCVKAARFVSDDIFGTVFSADVLDKIKKRAKGIVKREIPCVKGTGTEIKRFLSAVSPDGNLFLKDTLMTLCDRIYEINDTYGLSQFMLTVIKNAAVANGLTVYSCYCPLNPKTSSNI